MKAWTVEPEQAGTRADVFLAGAMEISRAEAQRLLETGAARVNGAVAKSGLKLRAGDRVEAERPAPTPSRVIAEEIPLEIAYEDADLLVIVKPRGMVVHPAPGSASGTLVNAVLAHADDLSGIGGEMRPGIVHRLDRDTSGLLVVAKNDAAHLSLQAQIQAKTAERRYQAVLWGVPRFERATVDAPIGRHPSDRKKMAVLTDPHHAAREAVTELIVREALGAFSFVEARLRTGRTHQIRVHCVYIGHPVVGDPVYGGMRRIPAQGYAAAQKARIEEAIAALNGQALHACSLSFDHPRTGKRLSFSAPMPAVMQNLLDALREMVDG
jgi:23S rRNA pseudouridine1911/1915/1917 synthase